MNPELRTALLPIRPIAPSIALLVLVMLVAMGTGLSVAFAVPGEKTVMALMGILVYPGPFLIYGLLGFIMAHSHRSSLVNHTFNVGAVTVAAAWMTANLSGAERGLSIAENLESTLFRSFVVGVVVAAVFALIMLLEGKLLSAAED